MNESMPKVSVIIPTYNSKYIAETVQSALEQTYKDFEVIVVDNGSTDNTYEIVTQIIDERVEYLYQENRGVNNARNVGVQVSKGQYICFLDADDSWLPWKLAMQVKTLDSYPLAGVVYTDMLLLDEFTSKEIGLFLPRVKKEPPPDKVQDKLIDCFFGHSSSLMIKRMVFEKVGMFDETLKNCQDYEWLLRAAKLFEFEVVPLPLVKCRIHRGQLSGNKASGLNCHIACFNRALKSPVITPEMRQNFLGRLAEYHFNNGLYFMKKGSPIKAGCEVLAYLRATADKFVSLSSSLLRRVIATTKKKAKSN